MPEWLVRYARPREGWLTLALLLVMLLSLGWSIQRAEWIPQLELLIPIAFYAAILGAFLGLTRLSVVAVLPLSAMLGTAIVLWAVGGEYYPDLDQVGRQLALRTDVIEWVRIVVARGYGPQLVPYAVGLGGLMWVTAFTAAYTIYRHHRVLDAILVVGAALIINMSAIDLDDLFFYLVLFMLAALLTWLRAALIGREEGWQRRRVNENSEVPAAVMRSGVLFIAGSIALAWVLTSVAVAAPLTAVWNNLDGVWSDVQDRVDGIFAGLSNPDARISGTGFGSGILISGRWVSDDAPVLTIAASRGYYLRTATYDEYTGHGFVRGATEQRRVDGGDLIFPSDTPEAPINLDAFQLETVNIQYQQGQSAIFTPGYPVTVLAPTIVLETGGLPVMGGLESPNSISEGQGYFVTALISKATQSQLNAAGQDYPAIIRDNYLAVDGVPERVGLEAQRIVDAAGAVTPFEKAQALSDYLRTDESFRYASSAPVPDSASQDFVDFFLFDANGRIGYCEYYATAMAVMARTLGMPSRVAVGYAPGSPVGGPGGREEGIYQVRAENKHAWAEVYFPGYGWERFESTKTISAVVRPRGEPVEPAPSSSGGPIPGQSLSPDDRGNISTLPSPGALPPGGFRPDETGPPPETVGVNLLLISAILLGVLAVALWRLRRSRRRLRFLAPGERQWFRLALAADRAGVAQRSSETIYEYAGWLEEQIPARRPEIRTIADGKVWQSYSGRGVSGEAIARIEAAWRRLQMPMLWLALRRRISSLMPRRADRS